MAPAFFGVSTKKSHVPKIYVLTNWSVQFANYFATMTYTTPTKNSTWALKIIPFEMKIPPRNLT